MWIVVLFLCLILLVLVIFISSFFIPVYIDVRLLKDNSNESVIVALTSLWGLVYHKFSVPLFEWDTSMIIPRIKYHTEHLERKNRLVSEKTEEIWLTNISKVKDFFDGVSHTLRELHPFLDYVKKHIAIEKLHWHTEIGVSEACETAVITGAVWVVKGTLLNVFQQVFVFPKDRSISVTPSYQKLLLHTDFTCIFKSSVGHIIIGNLFLFWKLRIQ